MGACASTSKESGDTSLTGRPNPSQSDPLLSQIAKNSLPAGKLANFDLTFDATEEQKHNADIVISFPLDEEAAQTDDSAVADPLAVQRRDLLMRLSKAGLLFSSMKSADEDEAFILVDATEERLMECAEFCRHEVKLKKSWQVPYAPFTIDRKNDFVWEDKAVGKVFSTRDRQTLIMKILEMGDCDTVADMQVLAHDRAAWRAKYPDFPEKLPQCGLNLDHYKKEGIINGYWAMHGHGRHDMLLEQWAYKLCSRQPFDMIFEYFNSKTALYFAFVGYYSMWLCFSAVFGVVVTAYDFIEAKEGHGEDNNLTSVFSLFMALWATLFLEFWKRHNAELAYYWSTVDLEQEEGERPEFRKGTGGATRQGFYSATGHFVPYDEDLKAPNGCCGLQGALGLGASSEEYDSPTPEGDDDVDLDTRDQITQFAPPDVPYMDNSTRARRWCVDCMVAMFFVALVLAILMSFLVMRLIFQKTIDARYGALIASTLQALVTVALNAVYKEIAICMVEYENYRTATEWEDAIIWKVFTFQFINSYFSLFYIAFLKGKIGKLAGYDDQCKDSTTGKPIDSCMGELNTLLLSSLLTTQILGTIVEMMIPYVQYKLVLWAEKAKYKASGGEGELQLSTIDHESKLVEAWALDAFTDYNKMAIQFGFVAMFVAAFPLAPFCALLNNILEIRTDAIKRLVSMQRPAPSERAENIGAWLYILEFISIVAVATNIGVLCFTSDKLAKTYHLTDEQRLKAFVIIEHIVILIKLFMSAIISDVPEWVTLRLARDQYMLQSREELIAREAEEVSKGQETLKAIGGVTLETEGAKAPMKTTGAVRTN